MNQVLRLAEQKQSQEVTAWFLKRTGIPIKAGPQHENNQSPRTAKIPPLPLASHELSMTPWWDTASKEMYRKPTVEFVQGRESRTESTLDLLTAGNPSTLFPEAHYLKLPNYKLYVALYIHIILKVLHYIYYIRYITLYILYQIYILHYIYYIIYEYVNHLVI